MANTRSKDLDRKKFFADPVLVMAILLIMLFLLLFIVYPLWTVTVQSFSRGETEMIASVKASGEWFTTQASKIEDGSADEFAALGSKITQYYKEYNKSRKNNDNVKATKADMDAAIAALSDESVAGFVDAVNAAGGEITAEDVTSKITAVQDSEGKLGYFALSLDAYVSLFHNSVFMGIVRNTLILGMITGFFSTLIGFIFAYVDMYTKTRFNGIFRVISLLPIVSQPFVLTLSAIMVFGKRGLITRHLLGMLDANIQGLHGLVMVQTMTFFPVIYLMLKGLLANIDPSMEEAARDMGASRWKVFTTVTLPLMLPGLGNAFLVAFIEAVADFTNPVMIGGDFTTLAEHIYFQYSLQSDPRGPAAMAVVLLVITIILFMLEKYWLERKSVATLTGKASRERQPIMDKSVTVPLVGFCLLISIYVLGMYALIPLGGLFQQWGRKFNLVTTHFETVLSMGLAPFRDAFILSLIAAPITALLSMMIAYLVVKRKFWGKGFMEFVTMFAMAVPGTVLGNLRLTTR